MRINILLYNYIIKKRFCKQFLSIKDIIFSILIVRVYITGFLLTIGAKNGIIILLYYAIRRQYEKRQTIDLIFYFLARRHDLQILVNSSPTRDETGGPWQ